MIKNIFHTMKDMIFRFKDDNITALASQISYSMITAFFPFLIFLMTLSAQFNIDQKLILEGLGSFLPNEAYYFISNIVIEVLNNRSIDLLSISLLLAVLSSSSGMNAIIAALNKAFDESENRKFHKIWIVSIVGTVLFAFTIIMSLVLLLFGNVLGIYIMDTFSLSKSFMSVWNTLRYVFSTVMLIIIFAVTYYFLPARKLKLKNVVPGAMFSGVAWIAASNLFSYYIDNFSNYSVFYGSLGALFIFMTWLYISSIMLILGGELNASLMSNRLDSKK